jgi:hypothetical protein
MVGVMIISLPVLIAPKRTSPDFPVVVMIWRMIACGGSHENPMPERGL